jgi:ATP-dependent exoDNAse (exonuclease V) beta subunit
MHNAKGLEFPVVFIAGMEEGLFPHSRSINSGDALQMEEERRLCYVGMTRARKKLYLSWARYRRRFGAGQPEASIRSRFLKEVPATLIENVRGDQGHVDLYAERHLVRETAQKSGRTRWTNSTSCTSKKEEIRSRFHHRACKVRSRNSVAPGRNGRGHQGDGEFSGVRIKETDREIRGNQGRMNTKKVTDKDERKKLKRAARKKAAPKPKRPSDVARGSRKRKVKKMVKGQSKR